jgi:hypothetical protein
MAILITLIPRQINTTIPLLVVDITREIVIEIISRPGNTRAISLLDQPETVLVDFLEQERRIVASEVPSALNERVGLSVESGACSRVFEVGEIVVVPMDDDGAILDLTGVVSVRGLSADGYSESEGEETDAGHQLYNYADEAHFLTPGPLLFRTPNACQHMRIAK